MRKFSFRPVLTVKGRTFKGLRGWAGKPFHPPLTDIPVAAYCFAAVFDVLSRLLVHDQPIARDLYRAGTFVLLGGAAVSVLASLTGWADWHRSSQPGTQARRTINAHALIMIVTTVLVIANIAGRTMTYDDLPNAPWRVALMSVLAAVLVSWGATYGGSLIFDYGFNVETAGDHPVWHASEVDVMPGKLPSPDQTTSVDRPAT
ncbi:MAG TPA: DUF2231 domain-containing protein [Mycobacteriales bacterium]|nr:DUF2231 domain-containing protein [Mycobacteriales bacterium]